MRILYVIDSLAVGGAESLLVNLTEYFHRNRSSVQVEIVTLYRLGAFGRQLRSKNEASVFSLQVEDKYNPIIIPRFLDFIKDKEYDIIHAHLFPASYVSAFASFFTQNAKWIFTEHNVWNRRRNYKLLRPLDQLVYSRFQKTIAVSENVKDALLSWQPQLGSKVVSIPNGIVIPEEISQPGDFYNRSAQLLVVGRLHPAKGIDILLEALCGLKAYDFEVKVVGEGSQKSYLERLTEQYGLTAQVSFLGVRHDVECLMQNSDCLLVPSRWEGLPMVILEAMANGLPVIASAVGGIPEAVEHGETGYLVPSKNVTALRRVLKCVLENPYLLLNMREAARQKAVDSYAVRIIAQQHLDLYRDLVEAI